MELLEGVDKELAIFKKTERPVWPDMPTRCNVPECEPQPYGTQSNYLRHWSSKHSATEETFPCPSCKKNFRRHYDALRHLKYRHKLSIEKVSPIIEKNNNYVDSRDILPFQVDLRKIHSLKRKRDADELARENVHNIDEGQHTCRDEIMAFNEKEESLEHIYKK